MFSDDELTDDRFLDGRLKLLQPRFGYRAGTDPVLLAAACPAKPTQSVLELGCGVGSTLLCLNARVPIRATGVERRSEYVDLAQRNAKRNDVDADFLCADLSGLPALVKEERYDHVVINPPFFLDGRRAENAGRASGRQEETPLAEWIDQALRRVKPKGYITLIFLTERMAEVIALLVSRTGDIEIKPLSSRLGSNAKRIIIRARKGSSGVTRLYNPLFLHDGDQHTADQDSFSSEARRILRNGCALQF